MRVNILMRCINNMFIYHATRFTDLAQFDPIYHYHSELANINLELPDSYRTRNEILSGLQSNATNWFGRALARDPIELRTTLQVRETILSMFTR